MLSEVDARIGRLVVLLLIFTFGVSIVVRLFNEVHTDDVPMRINQTAPFVVTASSYAGTASDIAPNLLRVNSFKL